MVNIIEINAIEYGGAIAHVAAAQLYSLLADEGEDGVNWFGGGGDNPPHDVLLMAEYAATHGAGGERLWIWGAITGLIVEDIPASRKFSDLPLVRRFAFDMFAAVCRQAYQQLATIQQAEAHRTAIARQENPPIKLEDSIFEPTGSLGELEKHSEQFLRDLAAIANAQADPVEEQPAPAETAPIPTPIPTMSIGAAAPATGEANEEETAAEGQETGGEAQADPRGPAQVRPGDADDGAGGQAAGNNGAAGATGEVAEAGGPVAEPADARAGEPDGGGERDGADDAVKKPDRPQRQK